MHATSFPCRRREREREKKNGPSDARPGTLVALSNLAGENKKHSRKKEPGKFRLEVQFGGDVTS